MLFNISKQAVAGMTLLQGATCRDTSRLLASADPEQCRPGACSCRPRGLPSGPPQQGQAAGERSWKGAARVLSCLLRVTDCLGTERPPGPQGGTDAAVRL